MKYVEQHQDEGVKLTLMDPKRNALMTKVKKSGGVLEYTTEESKYLKKIFV